MAKAEWGAKRQCPNCGAKFYDLNKSHPITCPKCAHQFEADILLKPRKAKLDLKDPTPAVVTGGGADLADTEADTEDPEEAAEDELEAETLLVEEELEEAAVVTDTEGAEDIEDDVVLEDDDDIDEQLIETDEDLDDDEVVDIPDPEEEKDL